MSPKLTDFRDPRPGAKVASEPSQNRKTAPIRREFAIAAILALRVEPARWRSSANCYGFFFSSEIHDASQLRIIDTKISDRVNTLFYHEFFFPYTFSLEFEMYTHTHRTKIFRFRFTCPWFFFLFIQKYRL